LLLIAMGSATGVLGILYALAQHDLKRLLAYSSVENIGVVSLGLGTGLVGISMGSPVVTVLGFTGALFHVINHVLFKGMLFLGAGSVLHAVHTGEIDRMGGLLKRMPYTGAAFMICAAAISGLPPLNSFIGEYLIFLGAFRGTIALSGASAASTAVVILSLAMIGGLAAACFAKTFGIVFLGEPRSAQASSARESGPAMLIPMIVLAGLCVLLGLFGWMAVRLIAPVVETLFRMETGSWIPQSQNMLRNVTLGSVFLIAIAAVAVLVRRTLLSRRVARQDETWGCGYSFPSPKMQYTASSFAQPIVDLFRPVLRTQKHPVPLSGYFPESARFESTTPDLGKENVYVPVFSGIERMLSKIRILQQGRSQIYVSYMVLVLLFLLLIQLR
jgi:NADH:ubiquinone oxidoreductase subunit 5 (subunit L)/multisubunit Na+/H+ antiporter MnhA subunit